MLGVASCARMAFAIVANSTNVLPLLVGKKNVGAEIDRLSGPLETPTDLRKFCEFHIRINRDKDIGILRDCLVRGQRTNQCDPLHAWTDRCCPHEGSNSKQEKPARFCD